MRAQRVSFQEGAIGRMKSSPCFLCQVSARRKLDKQRLLKQSMNMNKKLSIFIGLLLSDGSIYYDKSKRTYCIQFTNKIASMHSVFRKLATELFGELNFYEHREKRAYSTRFFSVKIAKLLFQFSPTYRTKQHSDSSYPGCRIPVSIKTSKEFAAEFLKAYASCDGSVSFVPKYSTRRVEITCFHPMLKQDLLECFDVLGISCRSVENALRISNRPNLQKFHDAVGFLDESYVSNTVSAFFGEPKMERLKEALR